MRPGFTHGPVSTRLERISHSEPAIHLSPSCSFIAMAQSNDAEGIRESSVDTVQSVHSP